MQERYSDKGAEIMPTTKPVLVSLKVGAGIFMLPQLEKLLYVASTILSFENLPLIITSGFDGPHRENSLHYRFLAVDIRNRDWTREQKATIPGRLRLTYENYGYPVDVVVESDHIHLEWDEKK